MTEPVSALARLTRALAAKATTAPLTERLCLAYTEILNVEGGAISIGPGVDQRQTLYATNRVAHRIEDLQDVLREGPSIEAFRDHQAVTGLALADQRVRWPALSAAIEEFKPQVVLHSFPIAPYSRVLGVVTVHQSAADLLGCGVDEAQFLANTVGAAIADDLSRPDAEESLGWLDRDRVDQATGMVVAQLSLTPLDALAVLRAHAFAHGMALSDLAGAVVDRDLRFSDDDETRGE